MTDAHEAISDTDLIAIQAKTTFVLSASGRIESENKPDLSGGPRLILAGCETGNVFHVHRKVEDATARALEALAVDEPPLFDPHSEPRNLDEYVALLSPTEEQVGQGLNYVFPPDFTYDHQVTLVTSGTSAGDEVGLATSFGDVMPSSLKDLGFRGPADIWEPWCIALVDGKIASIAETVRAGEAGVEVGVDTVPELRGRGYGAATTAGWALHPAIRDRVRFYGHAKSNDSSRRLAERLGLRYIGASLRIA